ncbi:MAG: sulfite exporter TauE/SafE family protein [Candidatus Omnitrophota bacterium]|nr:MAG: sulfite exporter TauE/SafE family protein [Candidatus Omnitrophota bacterium]
MWFLYGALGLVAGIFGGFLGIGGGSIVIPALVYLFGFAQHQAQGTALAMMVPPIVLLAAIKYYLEGNVKVGIAVCLCIGFFLGGFIGAHFAHKISDPVLKKVFGAFLLVISLKMILGK